MHYGSTNILTTAGDSDDDEIQMIGIFIDDPIPNTRPPASLFVVIRRPEKLAVKQCALLVYGAVELRRGVGS